MPRQLITEREVRDSLAAGQKRLEITPDALVTPLALEYATAHGFEILRKQIGTSIAPGLPPGTAPAPIKEKEPSVVIDKPAKGEVVAFGADHGGYQFKQILIKFTESLGYRVIDLGTSTEEPCDYPDFAYAVAKTVAGGEAWRGIIIDGAGIGSCVVANKIPGIRAACCTSEFLARNAREHNDTNVLTLGSKVTGIEVCKEITRVWLESWFAGGRHKGRIDKITDVERRYFK